MGWMDLDDVLSVQTPHFQFLTRPAALSTRRPAAHQLLSQKIDVSMIIQSISAFTTELINSDGLDNHARVRRGVDPSGWRWVGLLMG